MRDESLSESADVPGAEEAERVLTRTLARIAPADAAAIDAARRRQDRLTKPAGSLGVLEDVSARLAGLSGRCPPPVPAPAAVAVFAADHGVHDQGVTPWPQEVTGQMVANFLSGGAAVNVFAAQAGADVVVVDVGVAHPPPQAPSPVDGRTPRGRLLTRRVRAGTADFTTGPALERQETIRAVGVGILVAEELMDAGYTCLATGDMGIANTTTSAAVVASFTGAAPEAVTGRGTGVDDDVLRHKVSVVRRGLERHRPDPGDPLGVLTSFGGLEHAAIAGLVLAAAARRIPVILDGAIATAGALAAVGLAPDSVHACLAGHRSTEPGHSVALERLGLTPLVDLGLRVGEGTGAVLGLSLVQAAARALAEMATFDSAGVTRKDG
jgi:nicotinate-nucleotide--dimethylbenzimidazole phosphoribosyltransferase